MSRVAPRPEALGPQTAPDSGPIADLRAFLDLAKDYSLWLWVGAGLTTITLAAAIGLLGLAGWFLTAAAIAGAGSSFNYLFPSGGVRGFAMTRTASRYAERLVTHEATFRILAKIRLWVFAQAIPLAPGRLGDHRAGSLLAAVTSDVDALDNLYLRLVTPAVAAAVGLAGALIAIGLVSAWAALATLGLFAFAAIAAPSLTLAKARQPGRTARDTLTRSRSDAVDLADGLAELIAFKADDRVQTRLMAASAEQITAEREANAAGAVSQGVIASAGGVAAVVVFVIAHLSGAGPAVCALAAFVAFALFEAAPPLAQAAELFGRTAASARRLRELEHTAPTALDPALDAAAPAPARHDLCFERVSFAYPVRSTQGDDTPRSGDAANASFALREVELTIPAGARVGLVGPSGSGKSSLFALLLRFYDPQRGRITLGGVDVTTLRQASVRARVASVSQRSGLLSATIGDNLRLAAPQARPAELWNALEQAGARDWVEATPQGLDTWIGEEGQLVSGGQARRIALARALLKDAPILALDEPTEGLDPATEADIITRIGALIADTSRTVIIATHRPALLDLTDRVVRIVDGRIVSDASSSVAPTAPPTPPES